MEKLRKRQPVYFSPQRLIALLTSPEVSRLANLAAFLGIIMAISGRVEVLWTPEREWNAPSR